MEAKKRTNRALQDISVKIKTTISLPAGATELYRRCKKQLFVALSAARLQIPETAMCRDRAKRYNRQSEKFATVQVYWSAGLYNKLHAVAAAQRVSVSLLVYRMLLATESSPQTFHAEKFSNYVIIVHSYTENCLHIEEKIIFGDKTHPPPIPIAA